LACSGVIFASGCNAASPVSPEPAVLTEC
jgi:hypothetical protein